MLREDGRKISGVENKKTTPIKAVDRQSTSSAMPVRVA